jgi:hypothetical protein
MVVTSLSENNPQKSDKMTYWCAFSVFLHTCEVFETHLVCILCTLFKKQILYTCRCSL